MSVVLRDAQDHTDEVSMMFVLISFLYFSFAFIFTCVLPHIIS